MLRADRRHARVAQERGRDRVRTAGLQRADESFSNVETLPRSALYPLAVRTFPQIWGKGFSPEPAKRTLPGFNTRKGGVRALSRATCERLVVCPSTLLPHG